MRYMRFTVAVATAGAGVICLARAAAADDATPEPGTTAATRESSITLGPHVHRGMPERARNVEIIPCVRVGVPAPDVEIIPCVRVGVIHVAPSVGVGETNPPIPSAPAVSPLCSADLASAFAAAAAALDGALEPDSVRAREAAGTLSVALAASPGAEPATVVDGCAVDHEGVADAISHAADHVADLGPLVALAAHLHPVGWWWTEPLRLFDDGLIDALRAEATPGVTTQETPVLAALCASDVVADAAGRAAGRALVPAMAAAFQFDEEVPIYLDRERFPFVLHVVIEHRCPDRTHAARLSVWGPPVRSGFRPV